MSYSKGHSTKGSGSKKGNKQVPGSIVKSRDKQLRNIDLDTVLEKERLDQALNIKEVAVRARIAYSLAREWFQLPGFPDVEGKIFWKDFELWRRTRKTKPTASSNELHAHPSSNVLAQSANMITQLPPRAARILESAKQL